MEIKEILKILAVNGVVITEKELVQQIAHEAKVGSIYFKEFYSIDPIKRKLIKENREYFENLFYWEKFRFEYEKITNQHAESIDRTVESIILNMAPGPDESVEVRTWWNKQIEQFNKPF